MFLPLLLACAPDPCVTDAVAVVSAEIPTVVTVTWSEDDGVVDVGLDDAYGQVFSPASPNQAFLLGLTPSTVYHWRVRTGTCATDDATFTTGPLPPEVSPLEPTVSSDASGMPPFLFTTLQSTDSIPIVYNAQGTPTWWTLVKGQTRLCTRSIPSRDGTGVWFNIFRWLLNDDGTAEASDSTVRYLSWDGLTQTIVDTPTGHHDFTELPDGTLAVLSTVLGDLDGRTVRGDGILEVAPDGTTTSIWSAWDDVDRYRTWSDDPDAPLPQSNALDYDPFEDAFYLSLRPQGSIVKIDRASGEVLWVLGGVGSTFGIEEGTFFAWQHQFEVQGDGILVFDNGTTEALSSRVVEYAMDGSTARQTWSYAPDPAIYSYAMGDVMRLPGGNTLVTWGSLGQIDEIDASGTVVTRFNLGIGAGMGYFGAADRLGDPQ